MHKEEEEGRERELPSIAWHPSRSEPSSPAASTSAKNVLLSGMSMALQPLHGLAPSTASACTSHISSGEEGRSRGGRRREGTHASDDLPASGGGGGWTLRLLPCLCVLRGGQGSKGGLPLCRRSSSAGRRSPTTVVAKNVAVAGGGRRPSRRRRPFEVAVQEASAASAWEGLGAAAAWVVDAVGGVLDLIWDGEEARHGRRR